MAEPHFLRPQKRFQLKKLRNLIINQTFYFNLHNQISLCIHILLTWGCVSLMCLYDLVLIKGNYSSGQYMLLLMWKLPGLAAGTLGCLVLSFDGWSHIALWEDLSQVRLRSSCTNTVVSLKSMRRQQVGHFLCCFHCSASVDEVFHQLFHRYGCCCFSFCMELHWDAKWVSVELTTMTVKWYYIVLHHMALYKFCRAA